jgi:hypothetical protein
MLEYTKVEQKKMWAFAKGARTCEPQDCSPMMDFAMTLCPDGLSTSGMSAVCTYDGKGCSSTVTEETCPICASDNDCRAGFFCNTDRLCANA